MNAYLYLIKNGIQSFLTYRFSVFILLLRRFIEIIIQASIWRALIPFSHITIVSLPEMYTYVVISTSLSVFITTDVIDKIDQKIKTGEIVMDLIKPLNFTLFMFFQYFGGNIGRIFFELAPLLVFGFLAFPIKVPSPLYLAVFFLTVFNAVIIHYLIGFFFGILGFWYKKIAQLDKFLRQLYKLLSGAFVPLWFFPAFLQDLSWFLPFRYVYFVPLSLYLGKLNETQIWLSVLLQFVWIGILLVLRSLIWNLAIKRLEVQGG